jgi:hypothetical protein
MQEIANRNIHREDSRDSAQMSAYRYEAICQMGVDGSSLGLTSTTIVFKLKLKIKVMTNLAYVVPSDYPPLSHLL